MGQLKRFLESHQLGPALYNSGLPNMNRDFGPVVDRITLLRLTA